MRLHVRGDRDESVSEPGEGLRQLRQDATRPFWRCIVVIVVVRRRRGASRPGTRDAVARRSSPAGRAGDHRARDGVSNAAGDVELGAISRSRTARRFYLRIAVAEPDASSSVFVGALKVGPWWLYFVGVGCSPRVLLRTRGADRRGDRPRPGPARRGRLHPRPGVGVAANARKEARVTTSILGPLRRADRVAEGARLLSE